MSILGEMSHSHFKLPLTNCVGLCLGLVYLLQVTILPTVHYAVHVGEHFEHSVQKMQDGSIDDHEHHDATVCDKIRGSTSGHSSSHKSSTCSVCSNIFKANYSSNDILLLTNLFPEKLDLPTPDNPCLPTQFSPKSPRAPPSKLTFS